MIITQYTIAHNEHEAAQMLSSDAHPVVLTTNKAVAQACPRREGEKIYMVVTVVEETK